MITACWVYALQGFPFHTEGMEVGVYTLARSAANVAVSSGCRRWSDMENLLQNIASGLWIVLGVYCFFGLRKWNKRFSELYDELKWEVE